jgi:hypothetical protein
LKDRHCGSTVSDKITFSIRSCRCFGWFLHRFPDSSLVHVALLAGGNRTVRPTVPPSLSYSSFERENLNPLFSYGSSNRLDLFLEVSQIRYMTSCQSCPNRLARPRRKSATSSRGDHEKRAIDHYYCHGASTGETKQLRYFTVNPFKSRSSVENVA